MKLDGIKVLDLSLFLPGPTLTQLMADHGADVIKLEPTGDGEPNRHIGQKRDDVSVYFANTHRGKRSLQLNLKHESGRELAHRLITEVDVVIEAFRPGVASRLGMSYEDVVPLNQGLVYASLSAFGQSGPYVNKPAHDLATEAYSGVLSVNLGNDGKPALPAIPTGDMFAATLGLSAVLMALLRRTETGQGDYIDLAMMDSMIACMPNSMGRAFADKEAPIVKDERIWGGSAMYNIYETKDGKYVVLGASEIHFARAVLRKFDREDLLAYCEPPPGKQQEPARAFFREIFATQDQEYWIDWFDGVDAAFAPVKDLREGLDDPQLRFREMIVEDDLGQEHIGMPIKFLREPGQINFVAPDLGEHNEEICRELGYSDQEIQELKVSGVLS